MQVPQSPVRLICFYADEDEALWDQLKNHLTPLEQNGLLSIWDQRQIPGGANRVESINTQFETASIALLLLSADFLAKHNDLLQMVLWDKHEGALQVVPVLLRSCAWQSAGLNSQQIYPKNQQPIVRWPDRDAALENVAQAIHRLVDTSAALAESADYFPVDDEGNIPTLATTASVPRIKTQAQTKVQHPWRNRLALLIVVLILIASFAIPLHTLFGKSYVTYIATPVPTLTSIDSLSPTTIPTPTSTGVTAAPTSTSTVIAPTTVPVLAPTAIKTAPPTRRPTPVPTPTTIAPPGGTPTFSDPLRDNSGGYQWPTVDQLYGTCGFVEGQYYQITAPQGQHIGCNTGAQESIFGNFAYQITMTILSGMGDMGSDGLAGAGPTFRVDPDNNGLLYKASFDTQGDWYFGTYNDVISTAGTSAKLPGQRCGQPCPYFRTGLNQSNVLTVEAVGDKLDLWVNGHLIDSCTDSSFPSPGYLGVQLESSSDASSVAFTNLRVWQL